MRQLRSEQAGPFGGGHQDAYLAVVQDVGDLKGLEQWVERHEDATCRRGPEQGADGMYGLRQIDADALARAQVQRQEPMGPASDQLPEALVGQGLRALDECLAVGVGRGGIPHEFMHLGDVRHGMRGRCRAGVQGGIALARRPSLNHVAQVQKQTDRRMASGCGSMG